jgi:hypothetical protein
MPRKSKAPALVLAAALSTGSAAQAIEIETGFDFLHDPKTKIEGLHRFYAGADLGRGLTFGQAIYSGATGDAGGAFFWGFEGAKRVPVADRLSLSFSGFIGGGGGAEQVVGDGTMFRAGAALDYRVSQNWALQTGVSRIRIEGADINDWAAGFGLAYRPSDVRTGMPGAPLRFRSVSLTGSVLQFPDGLTRSGNPQPDLKLAGAEASFFAGEQSEVFVSASGAASGGDGYMQVFGGYRLRHYMGPVSIYGQGKLGFAGGGEVDTGAGPIVGLAAGIAIPVFRGMDLELAYEAVQIADTGVTGSGVQARLTRVFHRRHSDPAAADPQEWQLTLGFNGSSPNSTFMKSGDNSGISPVMQESSIDLFLTDSLYLTGNAQTAFTGGVAGYAVGLLGMGYEFDLGSKWRLSLEGQVGAAGGGGVNVGKGLVGGLRAEIDYKLSDRGALSVGAGRIKSIDGGVDAPVLQIGYKHRFFSS